MVRSKHSFQVNWFLKVFLGVLVTSSLQACLVVPSRTGQRATTPPPAVPQSAVPMVYPAPTPEMQGSAEVHPQGQEDDRQEEDFAYPTPVWPESKSGTTTPPANQPHPFAKLSNKELELQWRKDPTSVGSLSVGNTNSGALQNGKQMPDDPAWKLMDPARTWGTEETVNFLSNAIRKVAKQFPDTPVVYIGHISAEHGGHLNPHISHQAGRDVDLSYYLKKSHKWYKRATAANLDLPRTWALVRILIAESDVNLLLIDHSIQSLLRHYAESIGEDPTWLKSIFNGIPGKTPPIIRHAKGHATHMHVRFFNPIAQETGRRLQSVLVKTKTVKTKIVPNYLAYRARKGDTLGSLANRFKTTIRAIQQANHLTSTHIRAKKIYKIPRGTTTLQTTSSRGPATISQPIVVPPRRVPPPIKPRKP
jgi:murein endopeptidase